MFLLVAGTMFIFTACNCGTCANDCTKTCCAADAVCPNTGEPCLDDHSCCLVKSPSAKEKAHADHEGHDHELKESHEGNDND